MSVDDYASRIRSVIRETPHVVSHSLGYEDRPPVAGIVKGAATFADGAVLHFKEFLQLSPSIIRLKYGYQYVTADGSLIFRYDNARATPPRGTCPRIHTTSTSAPGSMHPPVRHSRRHCGEAAALVKRLRG